MTPRYVMLDHLCRMCGTGRVLVQTNSGPTGGGNPIYICSLCLAGGAAIGPRSICYCGCHTLRGGEYRCTRASDEIPDGWKEHKLLYGLKVIYKRPK